jgi:hypothetical protein
VDVRRFQWSVLLLGVLLLSSHPAHAAPLDGAMSITGNFLPVLGSTGQKTTLGLATGIDFISFFGSTPTPGTAGQFTVNSASSDFASLVGSTGTIKDFSFAGAGSLRFPTTPLVGFQSIGALTFDLMSVSVLVQMSNVLMLSGSGLFNMTGFDPTPGTFLFTANGASTTFSFSASQAALVPEPASLLFMVTGLAFGAGYRLRRRRQAI